MYIEGFIPNAMLRQFRNMWKKRKQTTSATTINNKMNGQSLLKLRTWPWYYLSWEALWDPQHQGPLPIISHSIFKPTSSQANASSNRPRVPERTSLTCPLRALTRRASLMGSLVSSQSPHCLRWCWLFCPHHPPHGHRILATYQLSRTMMLWLLANCQESTLGSIFTNVRTVPLFPPPCKEEDLQINSQVCQSRSCCVGRYTRATLIILPYKLKRLLFMMQCTTLRERE